MKNISKKQIAILIGIILAAIVGSQAINNSQSEELTGSLKLKKGYYQEKTKEKSEKSDRNVQKDEETIPESSPSEEEQTIPESSPSEEEQTIPMNPASQEIEEPASEPENDSYTNYTDNANCPENYEVVFDLNSNNNVLNLGALSSIGCSFKIALIKEYSGVETYECISTTYYESASPTFNWSCFSLSLNGNAPIEKAISIESHGQEDVYIKEATKDMQTGRVATRNMNPSKLIIQAQR